MSKDILKKAFADALAKELAELPSEEILSTRYTLSEGFIADMKALINHINSTYITVFGIAVKKTFLIYPLLIVYNAAVLLLYIKGKTDIQTTRLLCSIGTVLLLSFTVPKKARDSSADKEVVEDFGGTYMRKHATAMIDTSGVEPYPYPYRKYPKKDIEYTVPEMPGGYTVKNDHRSASTHTVEFSDAYGRKILYEKRLLRTAILLTVDMGNTSAEEFILKSCPAVKYSEYGENHIIWEDKFHQFHLCSAINTEMLLDIAQKIPAEIP